MTAKAVSFRLVLHRYWVVGFVFIGGLAVTGDVLFAESAPGTIQVLAIGAGGTLFLGLYLFQVIRRLHRLRVLNASLHDEHMHMEWFRTLFHKAHAALIIYDAAHERLIDANRSAEILFGTDRDALLAHGLKYFYAPEQPDNRPPRESCAEHVTQALDGEDCSFERTLRTADGQIRQCEVRLNRLPSASSEKLLWASFSDVTQHRASETELQFANVLLTTEMESAPDGILVVDESSKIILFNRRFGEMFNIPMEILAAGEDQPVLSAATAAMKNQEEFSERVKYLYDHPYESGHDEVEMRDGRIIDRNTAPLRTNAGHYLGRVWFFRDITAARKAEQSLAESETKLRTILDTAADGILVTNVKTGELVETNTAIARMLGHDKTALSKLGINDIFPPEVQPGTLQPFERLMHGEVQTASNIPVRRRDGSIFFADVTAAPLTLMGRQCMVGVFRDVTERRETEHRIAYEASHDALTGLLNRRAFVEAIGQAIARAKRGTKGFAVLYLDLDHFKDVNDTLGHPAGDELLQVIANRLQKSLRQTDMVARFGGDEFAVLQSDIGDPSDVAILAQKLLAVVGEPVALSESDVHTGTSIGISVYGPDATDAETVMSHADLALYRAKAEGRHTYRFFTEALDKEVHARVTLSEQLSHAIQTNQLFVVYQPQVDDENGRIVGAEGLVRWQHPERGVLSPNEFIPIAELSGQIIDLGEWMLRSICRQAKSWLDSGIKLTSISVNVAPQQFKVPDRLKKSVEQILVETGLPPSMLELEMTETALMEAGQDNHNVLVDFRKKGIRVAIDDFGTGYSSLAYLIRYPVDRIKIAQEFMRNLTSDSASRIIVKAALNMARDLGVSAIAEGVQTREQLDLLKSWDCRQIQGYYYASPLEAEAMAAHLRRGTITPAG